MKQKHPHYCPRCHAPVYWSAPAPQLVRPDGTTEFPYDPVPMSAVTVQGVRILVVHKCREFHRKNLN